MPELVSAGGADRVITEKANYFVQHFDYKVYIITTFQKERPMFYKLDPNVKHIDLNIDFPSQYKYSFFKRGLIYFKLMREYKRKLYSLLKEINPDFTLCTANRDLDILTTINDGSKKVVEVHVAKEFVRNLHELQLRNFPYPILGKYWTLKTEKAISKFDELVVLTKEDATKWKHIKQATVIPNSLPFYPDSYSKCEKKKIISVGRMAEQKGYDLLIESWKIVIRKHPDWHIHVYGNGECLDKYMKCVIDSKLTNSFHIEKPTSDIINKYLESSFYVMSSRFEGFGMVLIEAMACGLPCISFNCQSGPSEIISDQEDGILVENGNIKKLAEKICYLIENENVRKKMGEKARINITRYSSDIVMHQWKSFFESHKNI